MDVREKKAAIQKYCEARSLLGGCHTCVFSGKCISPHKESFDEAPDEMIEMWYMIAFPDPVIKDSGERHQFFEGGGVRDIQKGKGRCDLIPLDVVADYLKDCGREHRVIQQLYRFQETGDTGHLHLALQAFQLERDWSDPDMLLEVAIHFENGMEKYGQDNWKKGLPLFSYVSSSVRHYLKWVRGDKDEPHDRAFCWNIICAIWTCEHKPELNNYARKPETDGDT